MTTSEATLYRRLLKRAFDATAAAVALMLLSPVLALIAVAVRARLGAPVLFRQRRPGLRGTPFELVKFRTMRDARDLHGRMLADEERLGSFGRWLRATSLDELPELWNVLNGDMSLVGPRPLLMQYLDRYTPEQMRRHEVRPGITGMAQVSGRNALEWERKFQLDVEYVDRYSLGLDLRILARTIVALTRRDGISSEGHATAPEFQGRRQ
jgi:sugar transferase EpsL